MTEQQEAAVAVPLSSTEQRIADMAWGRDPNLSFQKLALEAQYFSRGFRLVSDKGDLVGVPHVVIGVTYREGYARPDGAKGDYISIEAVIADKPTLESSPIKHMLPQDLAVWAEEPVVYNDGGTGIRRDFTSLFHSIGLIDVGPPNHANENPFDKPFSQWVSGAELATTGIVADREGVPFRFVAARGLRRSDYESPFGPATTFYIG